MSVRGSCTTTYRRGGKLSAHLRWTVTPRHTSVHLDTPADVGCHTEKDVHAAIIYLHPQKSLFTDLPAELLHLGTPRWEQVRIAGILDTIPSHRFCWWAVGALWLQLLGLGTPRIYLSNHISGGRLRPTTWYASTARTRRISTSEAHLPPETRPSSRWWTGLTVDLRECIMELVKRLSRNSDVFYTLFYYVGFVCNS